jgi:hypothetical protein
VPNKAHLAKSQTLINKEIDIYSLDPKDVNLNIFMGFGDKWMEFLKKLDLYEILILDSILSCENIPNYYKSKVLNKVKEEFKDEC